MNKVLTNINHLTHYLVRPYLNKEKVAIDATVGNGNDTLFLCDNCKFVYGFDIQQTALNNTEKLLQENKCENYLLFLKSHAEIEKVVEGSVDVVMFNLGYLPTGDKSITTTADSVLIALKQVLNKLNEDGLVCLTLYGHHEGKKEKQQILQFVQPLNHQKYHILHIKMENQGDNAPEVIIISKKG